MNAFRKYITSGTGFSFLVVASTGLFFKFFFKSHALEEIHGWVGILMMILAILHLYQNWKAFLNHLKDLKVWLNLIPIVFIVALFSLGESDNNQIGPKQVMGNLFSSNITVVSEVFKQNPENVLLKMKNGGLNIDSSAQTLSEIAEENQKKPQDLLIYFK